MSDANEQIEFTTDDLRMIADVSGWRTVASAADEIDHLRNIISGIGLEHPLPKINTAPFRDAAKDYALPDGQIREHLNEAADWIEDRDYMIELEQKAHAATKSELARMREALEVYADRNNWGVYPEEGQTLQDWWVENDSDNGWEIAEKALKGGTDQ